MRHNILLGLACGIVFLCAVVVNSTAFAQPGGWGERGGGGFGGGFDPAEMLRRYDEDGDGMVHMDDIPERSQRMVARMAEDAGFDTSKPISIEKYAAAVQERMEARRREWGGERTGGEGASPERRGETRSTSREPAKKEPAVPGFGVADAAEKAPGFDKPLERPLFVAAQSGGSETAAAPAGVSASDLDKYRSYAASQLKKFDKNGDGALARDEWSEITDAAKADTNGDGKISLDELTAFYARPTASSSSGSSSGRSSESGSREERPRSGDGDARASESAGDDRERSEGERRGGGGFSFGRNRGASDESRPPASPSSSQSRPGGSSSSSSSSKGSEGSYRFRTAAERLPKGLPSWFTRGDADGDGQVSMAEYATTWTDSKVAEFMKYDLNGDGFITPEEYFQTERKK